LLRLAEKRGREALDCAPPTLQKAERYISLANMARILHCRSEWVEAGKLFEQAEQLRLSRQTGFTLQEAHLCDFLIETDQAKAAGALLARLTTAPDARIDVLNHGLYHYSWGRFEMDRNRVPQALERLDKAIVSLQSSGRAEELCSALVVRAGAYRMAGLDQFAENDLAAASDIANRGLRLLQVECALEAVSIAFLKEGRHSRELLKTASKQLASLGYKRFIGRALAMSGMETPGQTDIQLQRKETRGKMPIPSV
jgi:tetratricopeptide (TPR) repeat protein